MTLRTEATAPAAPKKHCPKMMAAQAYGLLVRWSGPVCLSLFLLMMRIIWGYAFFVAGRGKLADIHKPIAYFTDLHIPFPVLNAVLVSIVECFGGLLLLVGLGSRAVCIALVINMLVAYLTTEREALHALFVESDPSKFIAAAPFWFLVTSFLVLAIGPGMASIDAGLKRFVFRRMWREGVPARSALSI